MKKQQRNARVVESTVAAPPALPIRQQQQAPVPRESVKHLLVLAGLGLFLLGLVVAGIWIGMLSIIDAIQGHPLASWHHVLAWLDSAKWYALVLIVLCIGLPLAWNAYKAVDTHLDEKHQRAADRQAIEQQKREFDLRQEEIKQRDLENQRAMQVEMAKLAHTYRIRTMELQQIPFSVQAITDGEGQLQLLPAVQVEKERAIAREQGRAKIPLGKKALDQQVKSPVLVPDEYDLMSIMRTFPLAEDNLFLGKASSGQLITVDAVTQLCHGAFNASTGRGKTIIVRGIEPQLLKVGHEVIHADIKFALIDEKGNDYKPIARAIMAQGEINANGMPLSHLLMREDQINAMVYWLVRTELKKRLALYNRGLSTGRVLYVFLEELAYLVGTYPELGPLISKLLIVGRSLGIKVFTAAQNFQVQNLHINGGMRENFESAWYLGGDSKSAAALLDMTERELNAFVNTNNIQLGRGVSIFRNNSVSYDAQVMRSGMSSNDFVYYLLGRADTFTLPEYILPDLDTDDSGSGKREAPKTLQDDDLRAFQEGRVINGKFPKIVTGELVERREALPVQREVTREVGSKTGSASRFLPKGDDKFLPEERHADLFHWYAKVGNVNDALFKMDITNSRYRRHANYLVEQRGLKARRA